MRRALGRLAAVGSVAALGVGALAGTALADSVVHLTVNGVIVAEGSWTAKGNIFYVCDTHADGKGAQLDWKNISEGHSGSFRDSEGANTCVGKSIAAYSDEWVEYRVCRVDNGVETNTCTAWKVDGA
jgi:hypothetical protein